MTSETNVLYAHEFEDLQRSYLQGFSRCSKIMLFADENTYRAAGQRFGEFLRSQGADIRECVLKRSSALVPDERALGEMLFALDPETELIVAVGSGAINDLAKLISHKTGKPFVILATAASMDGFASTVSAVTVNGFKQTVPAAKPLAIMAVGEVLQNAPSVMTAAGLGDLLGKYTSLADWHIARLICGEDYSESIALMVRTALKNAGDAFNSAHETQGANDKALENLFKALVLSGEAMLQWGDSRPASGAEHHLAHFWEIQAAMRGEPSHLHGAKVGVATVLISNLYHRIFQMDLHQIEQRIKARQTETEAAYRSRIEKVFGLTSESVLEGLDGYYRDETKRAVRQGNIVRNWGAMRQWVEMNIPDPQTIRNHLLRAGGPVSPQELGIDRELLNLSFGNAREMRRRYTVFRLAEDIGFECQS